MTSDQTICITVPSIAWKASHGLVPSQCWVHPSEIAFLLEHPYAVSFGIPQEMVDLYIEDNKDWRGRWEDFVKAGVGMPFMRSSEHILPGCRQVSFWDGSKPMYILSQSKLPEYRLERYGGVSSWDKLAEITYGPLREHRNRIYWANIFWEFSAKSILDGIVGRVINSDRVIHKGKDGDFHECKNFLDFNAFTVKAIEIQVEKRQHYDDGNRYWEVYNYLHDEIRVPGVLCTIIADYDDFILLITI